MLTAELVVVQYRSGELILAPLSGVHQWNIRGLTLVDLFCYTRAFVSQVPMAGSG